MVVFIRDLRECSDPWEASFEGKGVSVLTSFGGNCNVASLKRECRVVKFASLGEQNVILNMYV